MQEIKLKALKREIRGRKVKQLRSKGLIPANVYGKKVKSQAVSLDKEEFEKVYKKAGETEVVGLLVEGEKEERPILIQNLQVHPVTDEPLHVDLRQIILTEKITAQIPVEISGEAPAAQQKLGILIQTVSEIEVEALPMELPEKFVIDVSGLAKVDDEVKVKDMVIDRSKVKLAVEDDLVVAKIEPLAAEEVAPPPAEETPVEGEAPADASGEKPAEEATKEAETSQEKSE
ncbi:50S ribosomal protein L25 [Candidatus Shapirobacteria bacterium CG07_land_8_20_14_0_80_39_18]|uniref:Large ribosomal subunit protein bL25 n=1 Tax=Candidatus Shapirobacteria bacterium CG07_land_8_20_14_0_80_39_18 TaxID=1974882 RepID=A0A2M6YRB7_9BACT|nr:MAG: 50S ribosomal protein L25 [Candidatus Shapirobacteria bacterium CG07_land_8_20_14_0_80_39_18]